MSDNFSRRDAIKLSGETAAVSVFTIPDMCYLLGELPDSDHIVLSNPVKIIDISL